MRPRAGEQEIQEEVTSLEVSRYHRGRTCAIHPRIPLVRSSLWQDMDVADGDQSAVHKPRGNGKDARLDLYRLPRDGRGAPQIRDHGGSPDPGRRNRSEEHTSEL